MSLTTTTKRPVSKYPHAIFIRVDEELFRRIEQLAKQRRSSVAALCREKLAAVVL